MNANCFQQNQLSVIHNRMYLQKFRADALYAVIAAGAEWECGVLSGRDNLLQKLRRYFVKSRNSDAGP